MPPPLRRPVCSPNVTNVGICGPSRSRRVVGSTPPSWCLTMAAASPFAQRFRRCQTHAEASSNSTERPVARVVRNLVGEPQGKPQGDIRRYRHLARRRRRLGRHHVLASVRHRQHLLESAGVREQQVVVSIRRAFLGDLIHHAHRAGRLPACSSAGVPNLSDLDNGVATTAESSWHERPDETMAA